jgi:hypothetical protein
MTDDLRAAAEAATPGPWEWIEPHSVMRRSEIKDPEVLWPIAAIDGLFSKRHANGEYIALASPDRILTLLDRVAELEEALEKAQRAIGGYLWLANNLNNTWHDPIRFREFFGAATDDARVAYDAARAALRKDL